MGRTAGALTGTRMSPRESGATIYSKTQMNPYHQLSKDEKLALTSDQLNDAIKLEAISRGIKPPVTLSEALKRSEWVGYQQPAESVPVYAIAISSYHTPEIGYLDKDVAERALQGMVKIESGYGNVPRKITSVEPSVQIVPIGLSKSLSKGVKFEEYTQDNTDFDKLCDECLNDLSAIRQADYNARVRAERRVEYLRLAGGNEEIAKAFWAKAEGTEWPVAVA